MKMNLKNLLLVSSCFLTLNVCSVQASTEIEIDTWLKKIKANESITPPHLDLIAQYLYFNFIELTQALITLGSARPTGSQFQTISVPTQAQVQTIKSDAVLSILKDASPKTPSLVYQVIEQANQAIEKAGQNAYKAAMLPFQAQMALGTQPRSAYDDANKASITAKKAATKDYYTALYNYLKDKGVASLLQITAENPVVVTTTTTTPRYEKKDLPNNL